MLKTRFCKSKGNLNAQGEIVGCEEKFARLRQNGARVKHLLAKHAPPLVSHLQILA